MLRLHLTDGRTAIFHHDDECTVIQEALRILPPHSWADCGTADPMVGPEWTEGIGLWSNTGEQVGTIQRIITLADLGRAEREMNGDAQ